MEWTARLGMAKMASRGDEEQEEEGRQEGEEEAQEKEG